MEDLDPSYQSRPCRRCDNSRPFIVLDKVHFECVECFLESCNKKIRSTIGKSKLVKNNDSVLISYSGGPSSCALADLLKSSMDTETRREQKFRPSILHVDMQSIPHSEINIEELKLARREQLHKILCFLNRTYPSWPIYWTTIEMSTAIDRCPIIFARYIGSESLDQFDFLMANNEAHLALQRLIANSGDLTDRHQFVIDTCKNFVTKLASVIKPASDAEPFKYILSGSTSTQLANDLMVNVILGHGANIRSTVSVCDDRTEVPTLRPLRDFSKKEIAYYLRAKKIEPLSQPNLLTKADRKSCIQSVTEAFLSKLYVDYPSTYSTLMKTGNKMI